ncbi:MAG: Rne/Rng family ribonuclease [bacterium]|jgi:ribonuclease G|nr:Rne/Rng family ribonuclease [bacterium]
MNKELVINTTAQETRIALLEDERVAELYIERGREHSLVGNIYLGKVLRVMPGMQAAFVDIGLEKAAFLHVADLRTEMEELAKLFDEAPSANAAGEEDTASWSSIEDLLVEDQDLLVEVAKEPLGTKGARITSYITLPGRHLVFMPTVNHVGVSRRIENEQERERLRALATELRRPGGGFIVRTAAEGKGLEELAADAAYLTAIWDNIQRERKQKKSPCLLHPDLDITCRVLRDVLTEDVNRLIVDSEEELEKINQFLHTFMPKLEIATKLYSDAEPIFDAFGIEDEITRALSRKVWLKSGGYITIEQTEALTAIDVNTGRFVGGHNLEDTIFRTNREAAREIAFQLRLRNIGGLIVIDFIDMEESSHREEIHTELEEALRNDRSKTNVLKISELGLVEMTRKRVRENLGHILCAPCRHCEGQGSVKSCPTLAYEILRELENRMRRKDGGAITVAAPPEVALFLTEREHEGIETLEQRYHRKITVIARRDDSMDSCYEICGA